MGFLSWWKRRKEPPKVGAATARYVALLVVKDGAERPSMEEASSLLNSALKDGSLVVSSTAKVFTVCYSGVEVRDAQQRLQQEKGVGDTQVAILMLGIGALQRQFPELSKEGTQFGYACIGVGKELPGASAAFHLFCASSP